MAGPIIRPAGRQVVSELARAGFLRTITGTRAVKAGWKKAPQIQRRCVAINMPDLQRLGRCQPGTSTTTTPRRISEASISGCARAVHAIPPDEQENEHGGKGEDQYRAHDGSRAGLFQHPPGQGDAMRTIPISGDDWPLHRKANNLI